MHGIANEHIHLSKPDQQIVHGYIQPSMISPHSSTCKDKQEQKTLSRSGTEPLPSAPKTRSKGRPSEIDKLLDKALTGDKRAAKDLKKIFNRQALDLRIKDKKILRLKQSVNEKKEQRKTTRHSFYM